MANPTSAAAAAPTRRAQRPDRIEVGGLAVVTTAAVVLSFSALAGLGLLVGFGDIALPFGWHFPTSLLVPLCIDAYGATAARIAVNRHYSAETRQQAKIHGIIAISVGILGNAAYHLIEADVIDLGDARVGLVIAVSVIPPVALGALVHLMSLCAADRRTHDEPEPEPADRRAPDQVHAEVHVPRHEQVAILPPARSLAGDQALRNLAAFTDAVQGGLSARLLQQAGPVPVQVHAPAPVPAQISRVSGQEPPDVAARRLLDQLALPVEVPTKSSSPGTAEEHLPLPVPPPTELHLKAVQTFAPDGRLTKVPPLRDIKAALRVGQPKAAQVQEYLEELVAS
ncbi:hypothetical protein ACFYUV_38010 [Nonomuraea sp. NPDC003560]|uniref:hypothetical protein n=1 Tax=Nonomuraea sp. NPDC003560 TaxID=3364341 RepID=UPI0036B1BF60